MLGDINVAVKDCTLSEDLTPFLLLLLDDCEEEGLTYLCRLRPIDPVTIQNFSTAKKYSTIAHRPYYGLTIASNASKLL